MATTTGGTTTSTALTSLVWNAQNAPADIAAISNAIYDDRQNIYPNIPIGSLNTPVQTSATIYPGAFNQSGLLYVPNRGVLKVLPGDYVMVDPASGWPILVSRTAILIGGSQWNP